MICLIFVSELFCMGFGFMAFVFFVLITRTTALEYDSKLQSHQYRITLEIYSLMSFRMKCDMSGLYFLQLPVFPRVSFEISYINWL